MKYSAYLDINRDVLILRKLMRDYEALLASRKPMSDDEKGKNGSFDGDQTEKSTIKTDADEPQVLLRIAS